MSYNPSAPPSAPYAPNFPQNPGYPPAPHQQQPQPGGYAAPPGMVNQNRSFQSNLFPICV